MRAEYFRLHEVAGMIGVSSSTVRRMAENGKLECIRLPGRGERRIPRAAAEALVRRITAPVTTATVEAAHA